MLTGEGLGPLDWIDLGLKARVRSPHDVSGTAVHFGGLPAPRGSRITVFLTGLPVGTRFPDPGGIAKEETSVILVWGLWDFTGRTTAVSARLLPGFVTALQQAEFVVPAGAQGLPPADALTLRIYSRNPIYAPRAAPDSNAIRVWVR